MKINTTDGSIEFPAGVILRTDSRADFARRMASASVKEVFANEDRRHFDAEPESGFKITVLFKGDRIDRVFIMASMPIEKGLEWTEALELERKAKHDAWLRRELGEPPYDYPWGQVISDYDPRGCASEIIITYAV